MYIENVLVTTDWLDQYPLSHVLALFGDVPDHTPLLLDTMVGVRNSYHYKFELSWMLKDDFVDVIKIV